MKMIVTLELDTAANNFFNQLRQQYYPAHANQVNAHLSLFYCLPDEPAIPATLSTFTAHTPFSLQVSGLQRYPNGLAYTLTANTLLSLHQALQQHWEPWLIPRDRQPLRPHITIMNGVTDFKAQQLYEKLQSSFQPFAVQATGIGLWQYQKGPWKLKQLYAFDMRER
ncbi:2'-5' RNA ligase [Chitinophaga polysaccharea]|uniref:2'-5' RNA ligase n=1 Tax=Chitinophaga polysaccharea TaxID=1293035 RepID=A0A561PB82_9BACT|nr:2'-5' RNA ligase family protein [Chitinophaga polysaccharea]TWF35286.1 2'-5' RNA ligase [Chitinophaga polysaccharea]